MRLISVFRFSKAIIDKVAGVRYLKTSQKHMNFKLRGRKIRLLAVFLLKFHRLPDIDQAVTS